MSRQFNGLQIDRKAGEIRDYGSFVNKMGEDFQSDQLRNDEFMCLLYILGLNCTTDTYLLTVYQKEGKTTLEKPTTEALTSAMKYAAQPGPFNLLFELNKLSASMLK